MNPSRLRGVPSGRGGLTKPSTFHLGCMAPRVCLVMSRSACATVSASAAPIWMLRSPCSCAGSRLSLGKGAHGGQPGRPAAGQPEAVVEQGGAEAQDERHLRAGVVGPRMPLSSVGAAGPRSTGSASGVEQAGPICDHLQQLVQPLGVGGHHVEGHEGGGRRGLARGESAGGALRSCRLGLPGRVVSAPPVGPEGPGRGGGAAASHPC